MKRIKLFALALGAVVVSATAVSAQKIGYVNIDGLVANLPEAAAVQQKVETWARDSVGGKYTELSNELREKDSIYRDPKTAASVKKMLEKELGEIQGTLGQWQQIAVQAIQNKQTEMFQPLVKKVTDAVNAYAKEKGYTFVLHQEALFTAPDADNISIPVAQKLGIKVNQNPPAGGAPATTGGAAPVKK